MKPAHKRMSRLIGYCLTLGGSDAWSNFSDVAAARLTRQERVSLAFAALRSLTPSDAEATASAAIGVAGEPIPPFLGSMDEARTWASFASRAELKCYATAAFEAMSHADQTAFLRHIGEVEIAA
ncbi:hypothetical protein [Marinovum algicola]|nr:hypothetical protein [Marinovum algicola]